MFKYFPHTPDDLQKMLEVIGIDQLDALNEDVPHQVRLKEDYNIPSAMSEMELRRHFGHMAEKNKPLICFAGAGAYDHYIPSIVPQLCARSEFLTSYTPYQAEISQGTLHYIFEFQTMVARLTGLQVSNASLYDGASATAEAMIMAVAQAKKTRRMLVSATLDPKVREVMKTHAHWQNVELVVIPAHHGVTDRKVLAEELTKGAAGVVVQQPNYYGIVEDFTGLADECHAAKALFVINAPIADLALLKTPGEWGADIAVGEAQSLGLPMAWGGPYVGYMCVTEKLMRKMPGRIVGQTVDEEGRRAFVLTLQAREQHIRRQKATSNICTNQSLMVLWITIYTALLGPKGLQEVAQRGVDGAHYLQQLMLQTGQFEEAFPGQEFFNEFCLRYKGNLDKLMQRWEDKGFMGGVKVDDDVVMLCVTEQRTAAEMEQLVQIVKEMN